MCSSTQPVAQNEEGPSPQLFRDVVRKQWTQPGPYPNPKGNDRRFYNVATDFAEELQLPTVDRPITALTSSNLVSQDTADTLKSEREQNFPFTGLIRQRPGQSGQPRPPRFSVEPP